MTSGTASKDGRLNSIFTSIKFWRIFFLVAALWNLAGSGIAFANLETNATTFFLAATSELQPVINMLLILFWFTVFTFAVGYLILAVNPRKNRGILLLAILGKTAVGVLWTHGFFNGYVSATALAAGIGDLIFAAVFAVNLCFVRLNRSPNSSGHSSTSNESASV